MVSDLNIVTIFSLETSNLKNIPKFLVVRAEKPANNTRTGKIPLDSEALLQADHFFCGVLLMENGKGVPILLNEFRQSLPKVIQRL